MPENSVVEVKIQSVEKQLEDLKDRSQNNDKILYEKVDTINEKTIPELKKEFSDKITSEKKDIMKAITALNNKLLAFFITIVSTIVVSAVISLIIYISNLGGK
jgi:hypothetical protein